MDQVKSLEDYFGVESRRQGDIFAVPARGLTFEGVQKTLACLGDNRKFNNDSHVFETRHNLRGTWMELPSRERVGQSSLLAIGTLVAPDHEPVELKEPHVLVQAQNLFDPKNAD